MNCSKIFGLLPLTKLMLYDFQQNKIQSANLMIVCSPIYLQGGSSLVKCLDSRARASSFLSSVRSWTRRLVVVPLRRTVKRCQIVGYGTELGLVNTIYGIKEHKAHGQSQRHFIFILNFFSRRFIIINLYISFAMN